MNHSRVNLHRSFAGLLVGNVLAIFVSGLVTVIIWQTLFPEFYAQLREQIRAEKQAQQPPKQQQEKGQTPEGQKPDVADPQADQIANKKEADNGEDDADKSKPAVPEFTLAIVGVTFIVDLVFATIAGFVCVLISGFARNNHGVLMALFLLVWKIQQIVGFVDHQLPTSLLLMEMIGLPVACLFGASMVASDDEDEPAAEQPSGDEEIQ